MPGPTVRDRPPAAGSSAASDQADETPPWLETAVHNLAAATLGDRIARLAGAPPERAASRSPPPRDLSPATFWCAAAAAVLALAALAGTPLRTSRANFATVPEPDSAALVSASQSARTEQLISASLGALGGVLHDATARGDEAVAAAARTEAALHQAERERSGAKAALRRALCVHAARCASMCGTRAALSLRLSPTAPSHSQRRSLRTPRSA